MHTRSSAAATALLLTASAAGLALSSGSAQATGSHHTSTARAVTLTVTIKSTKAGPKLSEDKFRPGKTMFNIVRHGAGGTMQVLRLKKGYTLKHAFKDFAAAFPNNAPADVAAVRSVYRNVVFYGGLDVPKKGRTNRFGVDIDKAGTYYVVNLSKNTLTSFRARGSHQKRTLPKAGGTLNMAQGPAGSNVFKTPANDPHKGWMRSTNNAAEPHFVALNQVKESTTDQDIADALTSPNPPDFFLAGADETNVISPGHSFIWKYSLPKGKYVVLCFMPSKVDGTPHALMGMFKLFHLN
jgi:hypothetical protein